MELWQYDATDLARLIRMGRASAREAVDSVLGRLHKVNPAINAVVRVCERKRAPKPRPPTPPVRAAMLCRRCTACRSPPRSTSTRRACRPTTASVPLKDFIAKEDSPVVANLKHAGAIIIGRTNAPAFSMRIFSDNALHGRTLNPLDPAVTPAARAAARARRRRPASAASRTATTSAARCVSPPTATAWSVCGTGFGRIASYNATAAKTAGRSAAS
jgi:amidase